MYNFQNSFYLIHDKAFGKRKGENKNQGKGIRVFDPVRSMVGVILLPNLLHLCPPLISMMGLLKELNYSLLFNNEFNTGAPLWQSIYIPVDCLRKGRRRNVRKKKKKGRRKKRRKEKNREKGSP